MITRETYPGIVQATIESREFDLIKNSVQDLFHLLDEFTEAELLDELGARARDVREKFPALWDLTRSMSSRRGPGVVTLGLPESSVEGIGPTPIEHIRPGQRNIFPPDLYRGLLVGMTSLYEYGFTSQQQGLIHNNVVATKRLADTPGHSASAKYGLSLHTEDASYAVADDLDISPDYFSLHFFRNPDRIPTMISIPDWGRLPPATLDVLRRRWYVNHTNPAQGGTSNDPGIPVSIVYGSAERPQIRLNTVGLDIDSYEEQFRAALIDLNTHLASRTVDLVLSAGSITIVDNRRVVHGRPSYSGRQAPRYDGTDRWSRRVAASADPGRIRNFESAHRVVDTERFLAAAKGGPLSLLPTSHHLNTRNLRAVASDLL